MVFIFETRKNALTVMLSLLITGNFHAVTASAVDHVATLAPYVNDDTFLAAHVDLSALVRVEGDASALSAAAALFGDDSQAVQAVRKFDQLARALQGAGVESVYAAAGLAELNTQGGPLLILTVRPEKAAKDVAAMLKSAIAAMGSTGMSVETSAQAENTILLGRPATLARYGKLAASDRADLLGRLDKLSADDTLLAAVFCPGPDFRRVVRELWPELPGPLAPLRGELADKWRHLEVSISASPNARPQFALQANDAESARTFVELWNSLPMAFEPMAELGERRHEVKKNLQPIVDELQPSIEGTRAIIDLNASEVQWKAFRTALVDAVHAVTESNRRHRRFHQFKEMTIAMLNYHDRKKHLPASAEIRDSNGRPLLSWRVAILPYLDEVDLYKQFHLNEPWDSPHNRTLIARMPSVYADPDPKLRALTSLGKTTYQVPAAPETVFYSNEGIALREITDGTSRTILIVEVEPSRAVEWTKPQDWEVDMQNPIEGVAREDRNAFTAGFADGHVEAMSVDVDSAMLRAVLTRSGKEVFDLR
jgi:hypothetical protein